MVADDAPAEIGLVLYPGVQLAAVHGLTDLFGIADRLAHGSANGARPKLRITHWQPDVDAAAIACVYDSDPRRPSRPNILVVPPTLVDLPAPPVMALIARWLNDRHTGGSTVGSVCSGAFLLAETGLLSGRSASTHWSCVEALTARFPETEFDTENRVIDNGDVITAGGFMAWIDLGLILVDRLLGPTIKDQTARFLTVEPAAREQRFFGGFSPKLSHGDEAVLKAQRWVHGRDGRDVSLASMAAQAHLESRTFLRRFADATGMTPIEYCRTVRIARARELLEASNKSVKEIAWAVGYTDVGAFTRVFRRATDMTPRDYRQQSSLGRMARQRD